VFLFGVGVGFFWVGGGFGGGVLSLGANESDIDQDHAQAIETVKQKEEQKENVDGRAEMDFPSGAQRFREVRDLAARGPAGIDFDGDQKKEADGADALDEPGPRAAITLKALLH
jgi:hypothetical protein